MRKIISAYVRCILDGFRPVETPPLDYFDLLREVRRVGYNIRQIAQRANSLNMVDAPKYEEDARRILNLCDNLTMICLPRGEKLCKAASKLTKKNTKTQGGMRDETFVLQV